jgi:hypothetical protein
MATLPRDPVVPSVRRLLLIDFDWRDTDWLPELFKSPGASVRLVAGEGPQDPGVRMAELCGLPRTLDLADLTREIFDLALVGERSSRRTQLESLLVALGTPCMTPEEYLRGPAAADASRPGVDAPLALHAAAMEQSLAASASGALEAMVDSALPDLSEPTPLAPRPIVESPEPRHAVASLVDFPSREAREHLEDALKNLVSATGAGTAEVHSGDRMRLKLLAQVGPDDRLLKGLVDVANEMGTPQLVTRLNDPGKGRTWAAWPFRTLQRRGVLAGASIDGAAGLDSWRRVLEELRATWDREDRERSVASYPLLPLREQRWLEPAEFRSRVNLAVDRHRMDGLRFELHRLEFPGPLDAWARFCELLPAQIRDMDGLSRPLAGLVVLLVAGEPEAFARLRRRLLAVWEGAWQAAGLAPPAPAFVDRSLGLAGVEDAEAFHSAADVWLAEGGPAAS